MVDLQIWLPLNISCYRLKCCELVITETDDFSQLANDYEKKLASSSGMSSEVSVLFSMQEDLIVCFMLCFMLLFCNFCY